MYYTFRSLQIISKPEDDEPAANSAATAVSTTAAHAATTISTATAFTTGIIMSLTSVT